MFKVKITLEFAEWDDERSYPTKVRDVATSEISIAYPVPGGSAAVQDLVTAQVDSLLQMGAEASKPTAAEFFASSAKGTDL